MKRVLHVHNLADIASSLCFFMRELGLECTVIAKGIDTHGWEEKKKKLFPLHLFLISDVIHYHGNTWFRKRKFKHLDYHLCKRLGKRVVFHFHGSDLRVASMHLELRKIIDDLKIVLVSTPDLLEYLPKEKATWLPNPINVQLWNCKRTARLGTRFSAGYHRPSGNDIRTEKIYTSQHIEKTIRSLEKRGFDIEAKPFHGIPHPEMPRCYSAVDLFIDKLGIGWYSLSACEAMASGLPVITYIRKDLRRLLPYKEPFLISSEENLKENLEKLLADESLRNELAQRGKKYVQDVHDGVKVAKRLVEMYQQM